MGKVNVMLIVVLHYALLKALTSPGDFPVILIAGFITDGLRFPANHFTQFPVTTCTWPPPTPGTISYSD